MALALLASLLLAGSLSPSLAVDRPPTYQYRLLREEQSEFRSLERSSILYGRTEFRVAAPAQHRVVAATVVGEGRDPLTGAEEILCRSSNASNRCSVDFGAVISRQRFRIDAELNDQKSRATEVFSEEFLTLDTHPEGVVTTSGPAVFVERVQTEAFPPDEVRRFVRVERTAGKRQGEAVLYRDDLDHDNFRVEVAGIPDERITSVLSPDPERAKLIPILLNVAPFLMERSLGEPEFGWRDQYEHLVFTLVHGLSSSARRGVDVEYLVVPYAYTARVFGPFRLHSSPNLDDSRRRLNEETLEALEQFLLEPPLPAWREKKGRWWADDFPGMIYTLRDLYLRNYEGLVQAIWITGGWNNPAHSRYRVYEDMWRFQEKMWPERLEELNPEWSDAQMIELLDRLDEGGGIQDQAMADFIDSLEDYSHPTAARITHFMSELDPGATGTPHARPVDSRPVINVLLVPSARSTNVHRMMAFSEFVREKYGGEIFRLSKIHKRGAEPIEESHVDPSQGQGKRYTTVAQMLERTYEQLVHSYVIRLEVPNPHQNGARHELSVDVVERTADGKEERLKGYEAAYMPFYKSSSSVRSRLLYYLGSGFKDLRLLSAYELRNHWLAEDILPAWDERWQIEEDDQIRSVLFESWVSINLKRLQTGGTGKKERRLAEEAYERLRRAGDLAELAPDPRLAREAAIVAGWYRADHRQHFDAASPDAGR